MPLSDMPDEWFISDTKFKLVLLTVGQINKLRYALLWQGTVTLFGKPAD